MPRGRKRARGGGGRQSSNYQREVETYQKKLEVINFHDNNGMQATLDKFYQHLVQKSVKINKNEFMNG
ncbi:hypothetical protein F441_06136 [Phytophthora nicotianae CJ01A1]|uniref:Uncharacterized protein n=3 Tax=Phytophthora nicotianae TaxID=4792 RepID=W2XBY9_PHYNI|nr:hypothetical protein F444_06187 [Phytophthora nicotianae P1976]ETP20027.1 hypothetical protein F441_06136 [Phytophthora nicotianae CJ01A1]